MGLSGQSAELGGVREIHDATHGPGPNRSRLRGAGAGEMVGRYDGTSLPVEGEGIGYNLSGELGRFPQTTSCPNRTTAGPSAPLYHPEEEVARPKSVTEERDCCISLAKDHPFPPVRKAPTCRRRLQGYTERSSWTALHPTPPSPRPVAIGWKGNAKENDL